MKRTTTLVPQVDMLIHRLPLRDDCDVELLLPRDLTEGEAGRLCRLIVALAATRVFDDTKVESND
jgi:ABC-type antimicrobial peptide transport system ATPase subunit